MEQVILDGATVGVIVTLLCTASITEPIRKALKRIKVLECPYCTSFWVAIAIDPSFTYFATVLFANIAIMLVHWSLATYQEQEDQT